VVPVDVVVEAASGTTGAAATGAVTFRLESQTFDGRTWARSRRIFSHATRCEVRLVAVARRDTASDCAASAFAIAVWAAATRWFTSASAARRLWTTLRS